MSIFAHIHRSAWRAAAVLLVAGCTIGLADAQPRSGASQQPSQPNALQGFSQNRNQPVNIESKTLEVRDKDKMATFLGNVKLVQGDTTMYCQTLVVFYDQGAGGAAAAGPTTQAGGTGNQQIKRIEAKGNVKVTQKDQVATGDSGVYDTAANKVTLNGNVVITQGPQVVKGDQLWVDLETGYSRVECKAAGCRVQALFLPNAPKDQPTGSNGPLGLPGQGGPAGQGAQGGQAGQAGQPNRAAPAQRSGASTGTNGASPFNPKGLY
jgi:lipopolysaccharide export system protein LptA